MYVQLLPMYVQWEKTKFHSYFFIIYLFYVKRNIIYICLNILYIFLYKKNKILSWWRSVKKLLLLFTFFVTGGLTDCSMIFNGQPGIMYSQLSRRNCKFEVFNYITKLWFFKIKRSMKKKNARYISTYIHIYIYIDIPQLIYRTHKIGFPLKLNGI